MNHREALDWRDVRLGLAVLLIMIPVTAVVFFLDAARRELREGPTLVVLAEEVHGLSVGADVWVAGRPSGRVADISFVEAEGDLPGMVALELALFHEAARTVRDDADARVGRSSLLASPVVKLDPGSYDAPPYDYRDTLTAEPTPTLGRFRALADTGMAAGNKLLSALASFDTVLASGRGTLPRLHRDRTSVVALGEQRDRAAALRDAWGRESGLRVLVRDSAVRESAARISDNLKLLSEGMTRTSSTGAAMSGTFDSLSVRAARLAARMSEGNGTLSRLATDDELRLQLNRTRGALDSLMLHAKAHPLRYLRLRLF